MSASDNVIVLRGDMSKRHMEAKAGEASIYPGDLLETYRASGEEKFRKATVYGARIGEKIFAKENYVLGKTKATAYDSGSNVLAHRATPGDCINARIPANAAAILIDDYLISNGDGTLVKSVYGEGQSLGNAVAASTAVTNTTTEAAFDNANVTIAANTLRAGDVIRLRGQGIATATNSTDTLTVQVYVGSTSIATTGAVDVANNDIFRYDIRVIFRTVGASGTMVVEGTVALGAAATVTDKNVFKASTAVDTTAAIVLSVKATWSVANAGNSVRQDVATVEKSQATGAAGDGMLARAEEDLDNSAVATITWCAVRILD
jgi:hypothetical protein